MPNVHYNIETPVHQISRADQLNGIGATLFTQQQLEAARLHFLAALGLEPNHKMALQNLGATLRNLRHFEAAAVVAKKSVVVTGGKNPYCVGNLGASLLSLRRFEEALKHLEVVVKDLPEFGQGWHNYGLILHQLGRWEEAEVAFTKSVGLHSSIEAESDLSLTVLALGRLQEGLARYEVRWNKLSKTYIWGLGVPEWQGEDLDGCRILVHHEQGFGDSIMLVRLLKQLAKWKVHITLCSPEPLVALFQRSFPFVKVIDIEDKETVQNSSFDYHSPMLSLMRWLGIKEPKEISSEPYLKCKPVPAIKLPQSRYRIGICWASGNHSKELIDRRRLVPLVSFLPLLEQEGVSLISLQKGEDVRDISLNGLEGFVFDCSSRLENFSDTANTMACLDLVISVDSSVAHLAGAIGKPCLMLSPYTRCWRWWSEETGWPWYNKMKLYHQEQSGSWDKPMREVIQQVKWMMK